MTTSSAQLKLPETTDDAIRIQQANDKPRSAQLKRPETDGVEQVRIFCRVRPPSSASEAPRWLKLSDTEAEIVVTEEAGRTDRTTKVLFDKVLPTSVNQVEVYRDCVKDLVTRVVAGYPAVLLAYGQSGSGKTYTVCGPHAQDSKSATETPGLVHMIAEQLSDDRRVKMLQVTAVEIYNKEFYNAAIPVERRSALKYRVIKEQLWIEGVMPNVIRRSNQFADFFKVVASNRRTSAQELNDRSTRSHLIITFQVTAIDEADAIRCETTAELKVIDLCGSERLDRSGATGDVAKETANINTGLFFLGNSINRLVDSQNQPSSSQFIPTRDDLLTLSISQALRGQSLFSFIFHVRGDSNENREETFDTLSFAARCKSIKTTPKVQKSMTYDQLKESLQLSDELVKALEEEIKMLKKELGKPRSAAKHENKSTQTEPISFPVPIPSRPIIPPPPRPLIPITPPPPPPSRSSSETSTQSKLSTGSEMSTQSNLGTQPEAGTEMSTQSNLGTGSEMSTQPDTSTQSNLGTQPEAGSETSTQSKPNQISIGPRPHLPPIRSSTIRGVPFQRLAISMFDGDVKTRTGPVRAWPTKALNTPLHEPDQSPLRGLAPGFSHARRRPAFNSLPAPVAVNGNRRPELTNPHQNRTELTKAQQQLLILFVNLKTRYEALLRRLETTPK